MPDTDRLMDLEIRIAYLEDTLTALDRAVSRQGEQIVLLERINRELYGRLKELQDSQKDDAQDGEEPPPPHY